MLPNRETSRMQQTFSTSKMKERMKKKMNKFIDTIIFKEIFCKKKALDEGTGRHLSYLLFDNFKKKI